MQQKVAQSLPQLNAYFWRPSCTGRVLMLGRGCCAISCTTLSISVIALGITQCFRSSFPSCMSLGKTDAANNLMYVERRLLMAPFVVTNIWHRSYLKGICPTLMAHNVLEAQWLPCLQKSGAL
jgi:hypothetical protein